MWPLSVALLLALAPYASAADAGLGRAVALDPARGDCAICHILPAGDPHNQGTVGPPLVGLAGRFEAGELRELIANPKRRLPGTVMPAYGPTLGLHRVPAELAGQAILSEAEIEAVVAWLLETSP